MRGVALVVLVLASTLAAPAAPAASPSSSDATRLGVAGVAPSDVAERAPSRAADVAEGRPTGATGAAPMDGPPSAPVPSPGTGPAVVGDVAGPATGSTGAGISEGPVRDGVADWNVTGPETADTVTVRHELALTPDRPGELTVTLWLSPAGADAAPTVALSEDATVMNASGFDRRGDRFRANRSDGPATLTYRLSVNRTAAGGGYEAVDAGPWALVRTPSPSIGADGVAVERRYVVDGEGVVGGGLAYLGPHETYERTVAGERIDLVVPAAADLRSDPEAVVDSVADAARSLSVGARNDRVMLLAAPVVVDWAYAAQQVGAADAWVRADQSLYEPRNAWLHEYVHTRQSFRTTRETRWLFEGTATYYAALLSLRQGLVDFDAFHRSLLAGTATDARRAVLAEPETWRGSRAEYAKGALVVAEIDRRIRLASDGRRSFAWVLARMNERDDQVRAPTLSTLVARAGGPRVRIAAREYTTEAVAPTPWRAAEHRAAFGWSPPRVSVELTDLRAMGPGGDRDLGPPTDSLVVATNERLVAHLAAENQGDRRATFVAPYRVNFTAVNRTTGRVGAGERTTETVSYTFEKPGSYYVVVAGEAVRVRVVEPARSVTVTDVSVARPKTQEAGRLRVVDEARRLRVVARISNHKDRPARVSLPMTIDGEIQETRTVTVGPNDVRRFETVIDLDRPGRHEVAVAGKRTHVEVDRDGAIAAWQHDIRDGGRGSASPAPVGVSRDGLSFLLGAVLIGAVVAGRRWV